MANETPAADTKGGPKQDELLELTTAVVAAYVGNNTVSTNEIPELISSVYGKLSALGTGATEAETTQKPAVPVKRSVKKQALVCLECGRDQKMLKRHLAAAHDMTPEQYRAKWRLPFDYPMVAPDYADKRRELAKQIGLGRKPARPAPKRKTSRAKKS